MPWKLSVVDFYAWLLCSRRSLLPDAAPERRVTLRGLCASLWPPAPGAGPTAEAGPDSSANGGGQKKDEGVIDAEYVDVEDKK